MFGYGVEDPSFQLSLERRVGGKRCKASHGLTGGSKSLVGWVMEEKVNLNLQCRKRAM